MYLDGVRFLAALWVALAHFQAWGFAPPELAALLPESGRDAVILFFVLSGFVIAHTAGRKDGRTYVIDRAARIYSVAIPIVLAATLVALWGVGTGVAGYERFYQADNILLYLGVYFSFLGNAWFLHEAPFGIIPYWSLNFEVWYYVLFGALFYLRGLLRILVFGAVFLAVGFKLWLLWPVWLAGVWLYRHEGR
ncbi:MAG: acyltransferase family protein, partial [Haliea sp.]